ncbi:septal ring lytic transglycosylase RlpA family protein [Pedobacter duraquae]|uniref:Probable endolytic peptidoglycan transglycosylase RlpA n=1 Tax=Pedobacter duraquae TaxID=425511 RepID=A0A4R6IIL9_9SPHI|nr:septal ring lytic transglycosylase RlpA family protein [Pedobacter duraquae]TDO21824.1 rare lipoprotein A [Pedobacter duraquae]
MKYCLLLLSLLFSLALHAQQDSVNTENMRTKTGLATYYAKKFEGRRTTSGKKYRGHKLTAAHLSLPFGTVVTVKNLSNGKTVDVVVNDRGPYSKRYIIDLSEKAAKKLGFWKMGQEKVEISYHLE